MKRVGGVGRAKLIAMSNNKISIDLSNETQWSIVSNTQESEELLESSVTQENVENKNEIQENRVVNTSNDNDDSFIVLNKTIKETVNKASLSGNSNVQQSMSMDTTLSSALNEIEGKLSDVLLENAKLKTILYKKNDAIRKQFNTIVILEKEVMLICENYKKRFSETKEVVKRLKLENTELLAAIALRQLNDPKIEIEALEDSDISIQQCNVSSQDESKIDHELTERELELSSQIKDLSQQLNAVKSSYSQVQSMLQGLEKQHVLQLEQFSEQLNKSHEELEILKKKLELPKNSEFFTLIKENCTKDLEKKCLTEVLVVLEQKMREFKQTDVIVDDTIQQFNIEDNQLHYENIEAYKKKFFTFTDCFIERCVRHLNVEEFPKECAKIIEMFKNAQISSNNMFTDNKIQSHKDKLLDYNKMLIDDQLQSIKDERTTINLQRKFFKVLSDYNNIVRQVEMLKNDNAKLMNENCKQVETKMYNFAEIERCLIEEKKMFDNEKKEILEERLNIEKEKQLIREEWELIQAERFVLLEEKDQLLEENRNIIDENLLLNQRTKALRNKTSSLQKDKTSLEEKIGQLSTELNKVKEELKTCQDAAIELRERLFTIDDMENELSAYKLQAEMQDTELLQMRQAEQHYLQQIENLSINLEQIRQENEQLRNINPNQPNNANNL